MEQASKDEALKLVIAASEAIGQDVALPGDDGLDLFEVDQLVHNAMWALIGAGAVCEREPTIVAAGSRVETARRVHDLLREAGALFPPGGELTEEEFQAATEVLLGQRAAGVRC